MSRTLQALLAFIILVAAVGYSFYYTQPRPNMETSVPASKFSTARAFEHVENLAREPHYVGSAAHSRVRNYIAGELDKLGLYVETQEGFSLNKYGVLVRPQNIMARIEGEGAGKALLLLTHYDSAVFSSFGASDAGSGVATILEGIRAYLTTGAVPKNDIILLFSDAEEVGLSGAALFVEEHPWAQDVGLTLNFEARGSGGNSFMFLETNGGNSELINHFAAAGVQFPVTNSLAYSVYKMLPNDTDLTVLREQADIDGFNFAFIDDHFDYHTATDIPENLDLATLAHQGSYLMPLLHYFSEVPLSDFSSEEDQIFFSFPALKLVHYPEAYKFPMLIGAAILFVLLLIIGFFRKTISYREVFKGFLALFLSLTLAGVLSYFFWQFMLFLYPQYGEMEHGFTYNGYSYIGAVAFFTLAICFYVYHKFRKPENTASLLIAPLFLWLVISLLAAMYLSGASYFIIPVYFGLLQLLLLVVQPKISPLLLGLLALPVIFIVMPFIVTFPVALGLKMLFLTAILVSMLFLLLWPVFGNFRNNQWFGFLSFLTFLGFLIAAHFTSDFSSERPKPNSLVYFMDSEKELATWNTYELQPDNYTEAFFQNAVSTPVGIWFGSKNTSKLKLTAPAPEIDVSSPFISVEKRESRNTTIDSFSVKIVSNRKVNQMELFLDRSIKFEAFTANGQQAPNLHPGQDDLHIFKNRWSDRLLTYYPTSRDTLRLELSLATGQQPEITLLEASFDLHQNPQLNVPARDSSMIPRPFVVNDAVVVKKNFILE